MVASCSQFLLHTICSHHQPSRPNDAPYSIKTVQSCELTWALGRHLLRLLWRPEEDRLARWAAAAHADALHVNDVLRVLVQVPQCTGARGGVHLLYEPPHADIFLLRVSNRGPAAKNGTEALIGAQPLESVAAEISPPSNAKKIKVDLALISASLTTPQSADLWRKSFLRCKADTK